MTNEQKRAQVYVLIDDMSKELAAALSAPLFAKQKHIERLAKLQQKFNQMTAKAVFYGE